MRYEFNATYFAGFLRQHIGKRTLRIAADDIGVDASTLCRILNGKVPNIHTFAQLCGVMRVEPRIFFYDAEYTGEEV